MIGCCWFYHGAMYVYVMFATHFSCVIYLYHNQIRKENNNINKNKKKTEKKSLNGSNLANYRAENDRNAFPLHCKGMHCIW